jgi:hypothetical protein
MSQHKRKGGKEGGGNSLLSQQTKTAKKFGENLFW